MWQPSVSDMGLQVRVPIVGAGEAAVGVEVDGATVVGSTGQLLAVG